MRTFDLLVSSVNITEDDYRYSGLFTVSAGEISQVVDISDLDTQEGLERIKQNFQLEEVLEEIKSVLLQRVMEKSQISSRNNEGENYNESSRRQAIERSAGSLDMA